MDELPLTPRHPVVRAPQEQSDLSATWPAGSSVVILSGGTSRRLGLDKATRHVGGRTMLARLLAQIPPTVPIILVGPGSPDLPGRVVTVREDPPGTGPLAGIGAGLQAVRTTRVGILAADMPFAAPVVGLALRRLGDSGNGPVDAVVPVDPTGHPQPLAAAYRTRALLGALDALAPLAGRPVRAMLEQLTVMQLPVPGADLADVDTGSDLAQARRRLAPEGAVMDRWVAAARDALNVEVEVDLDLILDVARDAAHGVQRPAAPVTTFLLGAAVARGADPAEAARTLSDLAAAWTEPQS